MASSAAAKIKQRHGNGISGNIRKMAMA